MDYIFLSLASLFLLQKHVTLRISIKKIPLISSKSNLSKNAIRLHRHSKITF